MIDEQHIGHVRPGIGVVVDLAINIDATRSVLLEEPDHAGRARTAIDPDGQRSCARIAIARFEEPPEDVLIRRNVTVSSIALNIGIKLADTSRNFFITHRNACVARHVDQISWRGQELAKHRKNKTQRDNSEMEEHSANREPNVLATEASACGKCGLAAFLYKALNWPNLPTFRTCVFHVSLPVESTAGAISKDY